MVTGSVMTGSPAEGASGSTELVNTGGGNGVGTCSVSVVTLGGTG